MNDYRFEAEITLDDVVPQDVVRERVYGGVRVTAEWPSRLAAPPIRVAVVVRGELEPRDAPAYVELFFHDVFLLMNLAFPGSFGGTIVVTGGELRVRDLTFDARVFARVAAPATCRLDDVIRWYDSLNIGTAQLATSDAGKALMHLLHVARVPESEEHSILHLAAAADAVADQVKVPPRLFELREDIARGRTPVFHPMHDDALDPRVEDATREWLEVADATARVVIEALQERVRGMRPFASSRQ